MIKFRTFLLEAVAQSLPHIQTMSRGQLGDLIARRKIHLSSDNVTEKSDAQPFKIGFGARGFWTQTKATRGIKVYSGKDYETILQQKAAELEQKAPGRYPYKPEKAKNFSNIHDIFAGNSKLLSHLEDTFHKTGKEVEVTGEMFYKGLLQPKDERDPPGERRFVATPYRVEQPHMGEHGMFVIHTQLPENAGHNIEKLKQASDPQGFKIDDDKIDMPKTIIHVPEHITQRFNELNHKLIDSRTTPSNKAEKAAEQKKFEAIRQELSDHVDRHVPHVSPKWSRTGTEGFVIHPPPPEDLPEDLPPIPRFKITSSAFRAAREEGPVKWDKQSND